MNSPGNNLNKKDHAGIRHVGRALSANISVLTNGGQCPPYATGKKLNNIYSKAL